MWSKIIIGVGSLVCLVGCGWTSLYAPANTQVGIVVRGGIDGANAQEAQQLRALVRQSWDQSRFPVRYELELRAQKSISALTIRPDRNYTRRGYTVALTYALYDKGGTTPLLQGTAREQTAINRAGSPFAERVTSTATSARAFATAFDYVQTQIAAYLRQPDLATPTSIVSEQTEMLDDTTFQESYQEITVPAELPDVPRASDEVAP